MPNATTTAAPCRDTLLDLLTSGELELPVLPEVSAQLLRLTNDASCEAKQMAELIRRDPSIATNLLRIANSAMYSSGAAIVSLQQSIARLGFAKIREIVLLISCQNRIFDVTGFEAEVRLSFRRSLGTAAYAQELARVCRLNVEEAFLCGLMHDVGRPIILQALVDLQAAQNTEFQRPAVLDLATDLRDEVGSELISRWGLPSRIAQVVRNQQSPDAVAEIAKNAHLLRFANDLAQHTLELAEAADGLPEQVSQHASIPALNIYPEQLQALLEKQDVIRQWVENTL